MKVSEGFREHAHTADWELEIWAPNLPALLTQAALGMQTLAGIRLKEGARLAHNLELDALDAESMLVRFLSELLWLAEQDKLGFDHFAIELSGQGESLNPHNPMHLNARLEGAPITGLDKEIKAVTYHNLAVRQTRNGLEAHIVFDV